MKLTIECHYPNKNWGHIHYNISQAVSLCGDVIITFDNQGSVTLSSKEFEEYKHLVIFSNIDKMKPNNDENGNVIVSNMQENDAILNRDFMKLVDAKYKVCNVAYRLSGNY